jgi:protein N-terminal methyltransferase
MDIVEPVAKFTTDLTQAYIGQIYNVGLESWNPEPKTYWLIWNQWCLGHLTDTDLIAYLKRCATALSTSGIIVVKENMARTANNEDLYDDIDSSVTRTDEKFRALFEKAELRILRTELQKNFPAALFPVRMYALKPTSTVSVPETATGEPNPTPAS